MIDDIEFRRVCISCFYIMAQLVVLPVSNTRTSKDVENCVVQFPAKITDTDQSRLWYMHDRKFNVPKGEVLHLSLFYVNFYIL